MKMISLKSSLSSLAFFVLVLLNVDVSADNLKLVYNLDGYWRFSVGDNPEWAEMNFDDSDWDRIYVPKQWENCGYREYNGYAWYRRSFSFPMVRENEQIYLLLGRIDDCDEVYLNGHKIGQSGEFPPNYNTAFNVERKYVLPTEFLRKDGDNMLAVRVYDAQMGGGIVNGRVGLYVDKYENMLSLNLSGEWKFCTKDNKEWSKRSINDNDWDKILVPGTWESQGYNNYDGYGWYRKSFLYKANYHSGDLVLVLGRIDDADQVFLNGKKLGSVYDIQDRSDRWRNVKEHRILRGYPIPQDMLMSNNQLSVRVFDYGGIGGIYEGPVGIMTKDKFEQLEEKITDTPDFWDVINTIFWED